MWPARNRFNGFIMNFGSGGVDRVYRFFVFEWELDAGLRTHLVVMWHCRMCFCFDFVLFRRGRGVVVNVNLLSVIPLLISKFTLKQHLFNLQILMFNDFIKGFYFKQTPLILQSNIQKLIFKTSHFHSEYNVLVFFFYLYRFILCLNLFTLFLWASWF